MFNYNTLIKNKEKQTRKYSMHFTESKHNLLCRVYLFNERDLLQWGQIWQSVQLSTSRLAASIASSSASMSKVLNNRFILNIDYIGLNSLVSTKQPHPIFHRRTKYFIYKTMPLRLRSKSCQLARNLVFEERACWLIFCNYERAVSNKPN